MATSIPYSDARENPTTYNGNIPPESGGFTPVIPKKVGNFEQYAELARQAEEKYELPTGSIKAMMANESAFNAQAVSKKGAAGLLQLMPGTAKELGVTNVFDVGQNIDAGAKYLKHRIVANNGNLEDAFGGYNFGPKKYAEYKAGKRKLPTETANYIKNVIGGIPQESIVSHNAKWGINQSASATPGINSSSASIPSSSASTSPPPDSLINNQAGISTSQSSTSSPVQTEDAKLNAMVSQNQSAYENAYAELQKLNTQSNASANKILDTYGSNPAGVYSALDRSAQAAKRLEESIIQKQAILRGEYRSPNSNPVMAVLDTFVERRYARQTIQQDIADLTNLAKARSEINKNINDAQVNASRGSKSLSDEINIRNSARQTAGQVTGLDLKVEGAKNAQEKTRQSQERFEQNQDLRQRENDRKRENDAFRQQYQTALLDAKLGKAEVDSKMNELRLEGQRAINLGKELDNEVKERKAQTDLGIQTGIADFNSAALQVHTNSGFPPITFKPVYSFAEIPKVYTKETIEKIKLARSGSPAVGVSLGKALADINSVEGLTQEQVATVRKVYDRLEGSKFNEIETATGTKTKALMNEMEALKSAPSREAKVKYEIVNESTPETNFNADIKNSLPFAKTLEISGTPIREKLKSAGSKVEEIKNDSNLAYESAKLISSGAFTKQQVIEDLVTFYRTHAANRGAESGLDKLGIMPAKDRYAVISGKSRAVYDLTKPAAVSNYLESYLTEVKKEAQIRKMGFNRMPGVN